MSLESLASKPHKSKGKDKSKKRKEHPVNDERSPKKLKSKAKEEREVRQELEVFVRTTSVLWLSIPPLYCSAPLKGAKALLDALVMRYVPELEGVLLSHSNIRFADSTARIQDDSPYAKCRVMFDSVIWAPTIGMKLSGMHSISSPSHISLLMHRTFNVSIPSVHIPQVSTRGKEGEAGEEWKFEFHTSTDPPSKEEDETFGFGEAEEVKAEVTEEAEDHPDHGRWVSEWTGEPISGDNGDKPIFFTVVGMTIANNMLSLIGSLQPEPFDERHSITQPIELLLPPENVEEDEDMEELEIEHNLSLVYPPLSISGSPSVNGVTTEPSPSIPKKDAEKKAKKRKRKEAKDVEPLVGEDGSDVKKAKKRKVKEGDADTAKSQVKRERKDKDKEKDRKLKTVPSVP